jgi:chromosome partitioning protein
MSTVIISFVIQKGGSGKTTLAVNCAIAAWMKKKKVIIFDMDPQRSAEKWFQIRENPSPTLAIVSAVELPATIKAASKQYDFIFIDTPARDEPAQAIAIAHSDFCVIPCRPSPVDLNATPETVATVKRLNKPFAFVVSQAPPRSYRVTEAIEALGQIGTVCPIPIVSRNAYQDAQGLGLGVLEFEPKGRAAAETEKLWKWLTRKIK